MTEKNNKIPTPEFIAGRNGGSISSKMGVLTTLAMMAGSGFGNAPTAINPNEINTQKHKVMPKGCKEFSFDGFTCIATSHKNAVKKYNRWLASKITSTIPTPHPTSDSPVKSK